MPPEVIVETPAAEAKPLTPAEKFEKFKADKAAAATPEAIAAKAVADKAAADKAAGVVPAVERRPSGDERKFRRVLNRELGAIRDEIKAALTPKPTAVAVPAAGAAPKLADFATPELFEEARIAYVAQKAIDKGKADDAQSKEIQDTIAAYNDQIARGPEKYDDWAAVLEAGKGAALNVDLGKECPSLFWAIARSPNADDVFYAWLKDSTKLQKLIDTYKSGPRGETDAIIAFHRFEGLVAKERPAKPAEVKVAPKAEDAVVKPPKPKPSAEASVRGGAAAPDGKPALFVPGTHTINPAYKAWQRANRAAH